MGLDRAWRGENREEGLLEGSGGWHWYGIYPKSYLCFGYVLNQCLETPEVSLIAREHEYSHRVLEYYKCVTHVLPVFFFLPASSLLRIDLFNGLSRDMDPLPVRLLRSLINNR
jgi:hypothetical protein